MPKQNIIMTRLIFYNSNYKLLWNLMKQKTLVYLLFLITTVLTFVHAEEAESTEAEAETSGTMMLFDEESSEEILQRHRYFDKANPYRQLYYKMTVEGQ